MRQIYLRLLLVLSILFLIFAITRTWAIRPIDCLPDCSSVTLNNRNLRGYDLRDTIMVEADLRGSDLRNANLAGVDFSGANLVGTNLSNTDLTKTKFIGANLTGADLRNTVLNNTDFSGADLTDADLTRNGLTGVRLNGAVLDSATLIEVNLGGVDLSGATIENANLTGASLSNINMSGAALSNADLSGAVLTNADLSGSWINLTKLAGTDLSGANLAGASLIGSDLSSADLTDSSLVGATAVGADFSGAVLLGANLTGVRLFRFELQDRDIANAPALVELNELRLEQVTASANLSGVEFDENTLWPSGKTALLNTILGAEFAESQFDALTEAAADVSDEAGNEEESTTLFEPAEADGDISIFGSSDVLSLTQLIAEQFTEQGYRGDMTLESVDISTGFETFCEPENEIDILNARRGIQDAESAVCATIDRIPVRFRIGTDAIAVVVNPSNNFARNATLEDLANMFTVERWNDVNPDWPAESIVRYVPSGESASRDLFLRTVFGLRADSADADAVLFDPPGTIPTETNARLILGVARDPYAIGFIPFENYEQNANLLHILTINEAELNAETVENGDYPLAQPLVLYSDAATLREKPQVATFLNFYLENIGSLNDLTSYFISSDLVLAEAQVALQEVTAVVESDGESDGVATTENITTEETLADIFTVPNPLIPPALISPTNELSPTVLPDPTDQETLEDLEDSILVVGNSAVLSPTEIIVEGFQGLGFSEAISLTRITTNQAFEFFCNSDEADIAGVNRVGQDDETSACDDNGRTPLPFRVGTDVIAIVTNPNNDFVSDLTVEEVAILFTARLWSDVNPDWPAEPIQRFIPPSDSSVFDLFVERVMNDEADQLLLAPNLLNVPDRGRQAQAITINPFALGFMEYPAYQRNTGLLNLVAVDGISLDEATIEDGTYPLLNPLLLYSDANTISAKPQVAAFLNFYLTNAHIAMEPLNYVPPSSQELDDARIILRQAVNAP